MVRVACNAGLAAALLAVGGCSQCPPPPTPPAQIQEAELRDFLRSVVEAVRAAPCSGVVRGQLGMAYHANGFTAAAAETYAQATALDDDARWPYLLALTHAALGDLEDALRAVEAAIALAPEYASAWLHRGAWLLQLDRAVEAADIYARALALAEHPAVAAAARLGSARALLQQDDAAAALALLEALADEFDHPQVHYLFDRAQRQAGQGSALPPRAQPTPMRWPDPHRDALHSHVRGLSGSLALAGSLLKANRPAEVVALLEPLLAAHDGNRQLMNDLAIAWRLTGRGDDALALLERGIATHAEYAPFHFNIALLREDAGDDEAAETHLRRALALNPNLAGVARRLASLLVRGGRVDEARETVKRAVRGSPRRADLRFFAGMVAGMQDDWPAALAHLRVVLQEAPRHQRAQFLIATAFAEQGEFAAARAALAAARRLGVAEEEIESARRHVEALARAAP